MFKQIVTVLALCQLAALVQAQFGWGFGTSVGSRLFNSTTQTSGQVPSIFQLFPQLPNIWDIFGSASNAFQQAAQNAINTAQDVANRTISGATNSTS